MTQANAIQQAEEKRRRKAERPGASSYAKTNGAGTDAETFNEAGRRRQLNMVEVVSARAEGKFVQLEQRELAQAQADLAALKARDARRANSDHVNASLRQRRGWT